MNYILQPQDSEIVFSRKGKKKESFQPKNYSIYLSKNNKKHSKINWGSLNVTLGPDCSNTAVKYQHMCMR